MPSELILVTGGARSGKSRFAESLLDGCSRKFYIATCPVLDDEMAERIQRHQADRAAAHWTTLEAPEDPAAALSQAHAAGADGILIDCLTLWINNLLYRTPTLTEVDMKRHTEELLRAAGASPDAVRTVMVINEVGLGIVPESPLARRFRDLSGRCAQTVAAAVDAVHFCVAGLNWRIK